ncbi:MAG: 1,4-alpha-glucan branching protein GlgB [Phycisphaerales bacterium]|nr:1,4-alpha-glucan branching protein GlgB [Phycisphaerales bacterium]
MKTAPKSSSSGSTRPSKTAELEWELGRLLAGEHSNPHSILGAHPTRADRRTGAVVRVYQPWATQIELLRDGRKPLVMKRRGESGVFESRLPQATFPIAYRLMLHFQNGPSQERDDPYRFLPTLGDMDLHLFNEGRHWRIWEKFGAHPRVIDGVEGVAFAVWAPNARRVSVVGDFCGWDGRLFPMRQMGNSGVFELFIPGVVPGDLYKYEIKTADGHLLLKADPYAQYAEVPPANASRVFKSDYTWGDDAWMNTRTTREWRREPISVYELHHSSWARVPEQDDRPLTYRELAPRLVEHVKHYGFTHIEPMPVMEHPFGGSWGYQVTGYYAPTSRYGDPDDFRHFVDVCHQNGIGVYLDWVPGHFPMDDWALARFDGTALYEHSDPRLGYHPDWNTLIFNYGRHEVRNFLIANALYWLREFHIDGLRVDAVASMLYLDYSRKEGEWLPNKYGGRENLEAIDFLRTLSDVVHAEAPGCALIAEESTAWGGVTNETQHGGLGFTFKWNMGWMHDTLEYFKHEPVHRRYHHDEITFAMVYEHSERFLMPLSHDEVVHGKGSLLSRMPGDRWQQFANLRALLAYQYTRPGKKLLFMGTELAPDDEWDHDHSLPWHLAEDPPRAAFGRFMAELGQTYQRYPVFWRSDYDPAACAWIDCNDRDNSVLSFWRRDGEQWVVVMLNLTPVPRSPYRVGVPVAGKWRQILNSDAATFGGSGHETRTEVSSEETPYHGQSHSIEVRLPPLSALAYLRE